MYDTPSPQGLFGGPLVDPCLRLEGPRHLGERGELLPQGAGCVVELLQVFPRQLIRGVACCRKIEVGGWTEWIRDEG